MGTGYNRTDTTNNIATGNIINASDLDGEFDSIDAAFDETTGHVHDGTSGNGAPITKLGPVQDLVVSTSSVTPKNTATLDLGTPLLKFKDLNLSGNALIAGTLGITGNTTFTGAIISDSATDSTSTTTGAIQTDGGLGVVKALRVGGLANIAGATTLSGTLDVTGVATFTAQPILSSLTASQAVFSDGSKGLVSNAVTGTGNVVMSASPTLTGTIGAANLTLSGTLGVTGVTTLGAGAILNTPASVTLTNATGLPISTGVAGLGTGVATALAVNVGSAGAFVVNGGVLGTPSSGTLTNATGLPISTGVAGLGTGVATALAVNIGSAGAPVLFNGALGTPSSGTVTNLTGTASININGTVGATTANTGAFTNLAYSSTLTGGTGVVNLGSGQFYKDASGQIGIGTSAGNTKFTVQGAGGYGIARFTTSDYADGTAGSGILINTGATTGNTFTSINAYQAGFASSNNLILQNSGGNVGIGTSSLSTKLTVNGGTSTSQIRWDVSNATYVEDVSTNAAQNAYVFKSTDASYHVWKNSSSEAMRIDSSGNLLVGTTTNTGKLVATLGGGHVFNVDLNSGVLGAPNGVLISNYLNQTTRLSAINYGAVSSTEGVLVFGTATSSTLAERMRIDSSGNLLVGQTSLGLTTTRSFSWQGAGDGAFSISHSTSNGNGDHFIRFGYNGTSIGTISQANTTGVLYNVTSDYRLKTIVSNVKDSGERIDALEPIEYDWNNGGGRTRGFLAHQFAEVYPNSVSGKKDAVDKNGNPIYQGMQASTPEVMADLIAEIQSLRKRVALLESK